MKASGAPKCRVCHEEHWLCEDHIWKGEAAKPSELCRSPVVVDAVPMVVDRQKRAPVVVDVTIGMVVDRKKDRHAKTEARREYLKMKKRESRQRKVAA